MPADLINLVIPAGIGVLSLGGYLFSRWFGNAAERALRSAARHPIHTFPEGMAGRIVGEIEAFEGKSLEAPLSGRSCVAYSVRVEEYKGQGNRGSWEPIVQDFDAVSFVVSDGTGRALVRAAGSWPSPTMDQVGTTGIFSSAAPALDELLQAHGQSSQGLVFRKSLRAYEGVLTVGMRVAVLGIGRRGKDPIDGGAGGSYRQEPGGLVIDCLDDGRLLMSNGAPALR